MKNVSDTQAYTVYDFVFSKAVRSLSNVVGVKRITRPFWDRWRASCDRRRDDLPVSRRHRHDRQLGIGREQDRGRRARGIRAHAARALARVDEVAAPAAPVLSVPHGAVGLAADHGREAAALPPVPRHLHRGGDARERRSLPPHRRAVEGADAARQPASARNLRSAGSAGDHHPRHRRLQGRAPRHRAQPAGRRPCGARARRPRAGRSAPARRDAVERRLPPCGRRRPRRSGRERAIDTTRVGLFGISIGGMWALRAAAADPRVRALYDLGGPINTKSFARVPFLIKTRMCQVTGARDAQAIAEVLATNSTESDEILARGRLCGSDRARRARPRGRPRGEAMAA